MQTTHKPISMVCQAGTVKEEPPQSHRLLESGYHGPEQNHRDAAGVVAHCSATLDTLLGARAGKTECHVPSVLVLMRGPLMLKKAEEAAVDFHGR